MERDVWQRVLLREEQDSLEQMRRRALESAQALKGLWKRGEGEALLPLANFQEQAFSALGGILFLQGERGQSAPGFPVQGSKTGILSACCRRSMENYRQFASRRGAGTLGAVFDILAQREGECLLRALALLGQWTEGSR